MVRGWYSKTPDAFIFAAIALQVISHEKVLVECDAEIKALLAAMVCLGEKLGPLLFQLNYIDKLQQPPTDCAECQKLNKSRRTSPSHYQSRE